MGRDLKYMDDDGEGEEENCCVAVWCDGVWLLWLWKNSPYTGASSMSASDKSENDRVLVLAGHAPFWVGKGGCAGKRDGELGAQRDHR